MKRFLFIVFIVGMANKCFAQDTVIHKEKHNSIGIYAGFSAFNQYGFDNLSNFIQLYPNTQSLFPPLEFLISFKHKKHEFIAGLYGTTYMPNHTEKFFIFGGTASYLYHFNKKKVHLFFEGNFKLFAYTSPLSDAFIIPYNSTINNWGLSVNPASICTIVLHPAIGIEIKLWRFIYYQIAVGSGFYHIKAHDTYPQNASYPSLYTDATIYKGKYGFDWYARMSFAFRIYNF